MQDEQKQVQTLSQLGPGMQSQTQMAAGVMVQVGPCPFKFLAKGAQCAHCTPCMLATGHGKYLGTAHARLSPHRLCCRRDSLAEQLQTRVRAMRLRMRLR